MYESDQTALENTNEAMPYVPDTMENPNPQANNAASQNSMDGVDIVTEENTIFQGTTV